MVVLKVELLHVSLVLCASGKIYQLSSFHFKILHYIYTPLYIPEKQVELHPSSLRTSLQLRSRLRTLSLNLDTVLFSLDSAPALSLLYSCTHVLALTLAFPHSCYCAPTP